LEKKRPDVIDIGLQPER